MSESIEKLIIEITADKLGISTDEITLESSFVDDLGADSLHIVDLVMAMEDEYGFEVSEEQAESILTVKDAVEFVISNK